MQTTTVTVTGKGSNPKTALYVGGLEEEVKEDLLKAAFIPFGPIKECNIPLDNETGKNRGFGFVEFEERDDAADAIDNMHNAELNGRCAQACMRARAGKQGCRARTAHCQQRVCVLLTCGRDGHHTVLCAAAACLRFGAGRHAPAPPGPPIAPRQKTPFQSRLRFPCP